MNAPFRERHLESLKDFIHKSVSDAQDTGYKAAVNIYEKAGKNDKRLIEQLSKVIEEFKIQLKKNT